MRQAETLDGDSLSSRMTTFGFLMHLKRGVPPLDAFNPRSAALIILSHVRAQQAQRSGSSSMASSYRIGADSVPSITGKSQESSVDTLLGSYGAADREDIGGGKD